uniref:Uncharacterized protein n=2 Tax=Caenorhabditis japonica TaxID=281687 RepID=A0A8R1IL92_CAEJA
MSDVFHILWIFRVATMDERNGNQNTGIYDCVDGGILFEDSGETEDNMDERHRAPVYSHMCGAIPKCTTLPVDKLNPSFVKYIVQEVRESLNQSEIAFYVYGDFRCFELNST